MNKDTTTPEDVGVKVADKLRKALFKEQQRYTDAVVQALADLGRTYIQSLRLPEVDYSTVLRDRVDYAEQLQKEADAAARVSVRSR